MPWYTYPAIDMLRYRAYENKIVMEFGGGQSTLWWAQRAKHVVTLEGDPDWYRAIKDTMPANVDLHHVSMADANTNVSQVSDVLASKPYAQYDVIVIDGLYRYELIDVACNRLAPDGIIICDNAEGYNIHAGFKDRGLDRVDFYGNAPGVVLPHCTCIYFKSSAFLFDPVIPIHVIARE